MGQRSTSWLAISTALDNQAHGDDQLSCVVTEEAALLAVADGVSQYLKLYSRIWFMKHQER
jgi:hypothetical protein